MADHPLGVSVPSPDRFHFSNLNSELRFSKGTSGSKSSPPPLGSKGTNGVNSSSGSVLATKPETFSSTDSLGFRNAAAGFNCISRNLPSPQSLKCLISPDTVFAVAFPLLLRRACHEPSLACVTTQSRSAGVPASIPSLYLNRTLTGVLNFCPSGEKRYETPATPKGAVLVMGWMEMTVLASNAPAGISSVTNPSAEAILPPAAPIVAEEAVPVGVPHP